MAGRTSVFLGERPDPERGRQLGAAPPRHFWVALWGREAVHGARAPARPGTRRRPPAIQESPEITGLDIGSRRVDRLDDPGGLVPQQGTGKSSVDRPFPS